MTVAEAKQTLTALQQRLVEHQTTAFVAAYSQCEHCGKSLGIKGYHTRTFRTLFGTVTLTSPRLYYCRCQRRKTTTFRPWAFRRSAYRAKNIATSASMAWAKSRWAP